MPKYRKFSIVCHNLQPGNKHVFEKYFSDAKTRVIGEEPYPDPENPGQPDPTRPDVHMHIFCEFHNQRSHSKVLKDLQNIVKRIVWPEQLREGMWGRVQVDQGKGNESEWLDYLGGKTKEKPVDGDVSAEHTPGRNQYKCYSCGTVEHGLFFTYSHMTGEGVCDRCVRIYKELDPEGVWVFDAQAYRMGFQWSGLKRLKAMRFFS